METIQSIYPLCSLLLGKNTPQLPDNQLLELAEFLLEYPDNLRSHPYLADLARIEADAGGTRTMAGRADGGMEALDPTLTDDGGHLNARGQLLVAGAFLNKIAELSSR